MRVLLWRQVKLAITVSLLCLSGACASAFTIGQTVAVLREPAEFHARERMHLHEEIHRSQYRRIGTLRMLALYSLFESQRLTLEAEAYAAELCYLDRVGTGVPEAWRAGFAEALRTYSLPPKITRPQAAEYLARAYRDGAACVRLLDRADRDWVLAAYPRQGT